MSMTVLTAKRRLVPVALTLLAMASLSGCNNFFTPTGTPANTATFATQTQVFLNSTDTQPIMTMPRPYQPLYGTSGTNIFGSSFGTVPYADTTSIKGVLSESNLVAGTWDVYYNWLPQPQGCSSPSAVPPYGTTSGDWNILSVPNGSYIDPNPNNPLTIAYTNNAYTAPAFNCNVLAQDIDSVTPNSITAASLPQTVTVQFGTAAGNNAPLAGLAPSDVQLQIYDSYGTPVASPQAQAIYNTTNPNTATFVIPSTNSQGVALSNGMYGTLAIQTGGFAIPGSGNMVLGGEGYFFVGSANANYQSPFGVAVQDLSRITTSCTSGGGVGGLTASPSPNMAPPTLPACTTASTQRSYPVVTSLSNGTISSGTGSATVGTNPVAVVTYGTYDKSTSTQWPNGAPRLSVDTSGTGFALTTNQGSNNISIVNIVTDTLVATVAVGVSPVAAVVDTNGAYAYVANYGSGTVSKVSLSNYSVVGTINTGPNPSAVSLDASGNLWVGGAGYITEFNVQTYTATATTAVNGIVNSLAVSSGQNRVLSNIVQPPTKAIPHAMAQVATSSTSAMVTPAAQFNNVGDAYSTSTIVKYLPSPYLLGGGTVVSAKYNNSLSITATPGGYIVQDVKNGFVLASGTTAAPIRAIAVDQTFGYAYMTVPDTNTVITFPMPGSN